MERDYASWAKDYAVLRAIASYHRRGDDDALGKPISWVVWHELANFANYKNPFGTWNCRNGGGFTDFSLFVATPQKSFGKCDSPTRAYFGIFHRGFGKISISHLRSKK